MDTWVDAGLAMVRSREQARGLFGWDCISTSSAVQLGRERILPLCEGRSCALRRAFLDGRLEFETLRTASSASLWTWCAKKSLDLVLGATRPGQLERTVSEGKAETQLADQLLESISASSRKCMNLVLLGKRLGISRDPAFGAECRDTTSTLTPITMTT